MKIIFNVTIMLAVSLLCITNTQIEGYYTLLCTPFVAYLLGIISGGISDDIEEENKNKQIR